MVLEALAAIGLASNILQFVDFVSEVYSEAKQIHSAASGSSKRISELEDVATGLRHASAGIQRPPRSICTDNTLQALAARCEDVSNELLSALDKLKRKEGVEDNRSRFMGRIIRRMESVREALKVVWKDGQIQALHNRITVIRSDLEIRLQSRTWQDVNELKQDVQKFLNAQNANDFSQLATLQDVKSILTALETLKREFKSIEGSFNLSTAIPDFVARSQEILNSLRFSTMDMRLGRIPHSHAQTFDWIFCNDNFAPEDPRSSIAFVDWLKFRSGIYWVSGKPGSGKSTLMKHLASHAQTTTHLQEWAGENQLVVAKFFFWHAGTDLQKSLQGLLQSLLYEILRQCPDRIQEVCKSRWNSCGLYPNSYRPAFSPEKAHGDPWDVREMTQVLTSLARWDSGSTKFCFFIDGLDEFDGDHNEVIDLLKEIQESLDIKLCLSSRPWNCFENHFGRDETLKLYLQDLTREDINSYVRDKLGQRLQYIRRSSIRSEVERLMEEVVVKAQGVFLWVFLAVRSLVRGFENGDSLSLLRKRLNAFPPELHDFFNHILRSVEPIYQSITALLFEAALKASHPLDLLTCSFLVEEDDDIPVTIPIQTLSQEEIDARREDARRAINACCLGLLEVYTVPNAQWKCGDDDWYGESIQFLHRTVQDFLIHDQIRSAWILPPSTCIYTTIAQALLARLKIHTCSYRPYKCPQIARVFDYCRLAERSGNPTDTRVLTELSKVIHMNYSQSRPVKMTLISRELIQIAVRLAVENGLSLFLCDLAAAGQIDLSKDGPSLLYWSLEFSFPLEPGFVGVIKLILEHGANPNMPTGRYGTVWSRMMDKLLSSSFSHSQVELMATLVAHGANINVRLACNRLAWGRLLVEGLHLNGASDHLVQSIQLFLDNGANPNDKYKLGSPKTVWETLLKELWTTRQNWALGGLIELMLRHGANTSATINNGTQTFTVMNVIEANLSPHDLQKLEVLSSYETESVPARDQDPGFLELTATSL